MLFTRHLEGRNVTTHGPAYSILVEKTRWRMHVGAPSLNGIVTVPCVASLRNADVSWTTRCRTQPPRRDPHSSLHLKGHTRIGSLRGLIAADVLSGTSEGSKPLETKSGQCTDKAQLRAAHSSNPDEVLSSINPPNPKTA